VNYYVGTPPQHRQRNYSGGFTKVINDTRTSCWLHRPAISNDTREEGLLTTILHGRRVDSIPLCAQMHPSSTPNFKDSNYLRLLQRMEQLIIPINIQASRYQIMENL
jgi:hypothetical protein